MKFLAGLILGSFFGVAFMCLCASAKHGDKIGEDEEYEAKSFHESD